MGVSFGTPLTTLCGIQRTRNWPLPSPGISQPKPLIGRLHLPAIADFLIEDAVLVADAVTDGGNIERSQGIHETGGQAAQAAVAQSRLLLLLNQGLQVQAQP